MEKIFLLVIKNNKNYCYFKQQIYEYIKYALQIKQKIFYINMFYLKKKIFFLCK